MSYYFSKTITANFDTAVAKVIDALAAEGFGIITEIDVTQTFKKKIGVDFRPYRILGACNPQAAHEALQIEDKAGTMLPCNVIVQEVEPGHVEVAAIDPVASMASIPNAALRDKAAMIGERLKRVIEAL